MEEVYIVREEYNIGGEVKINTYHCSTYGIAQIIFNARKRIWNEQNTYFKGEIFNSDIFQVKDSPNVYSILDESVNYYVSITIQTKQK